jgi:hypothetical protein
MRTARRLIQLAALAFAVTALAAPAYATTIAAVGNAVATENEAGSFDNGNLSITCQSSDATLTLGNSGAATIDALTFAGCTEPVAGMACTFTVADLPQNATITNVGPAAELTLDGPPYFGITVDCGALTCAYQMIATLTVGVTGGASPRLHVRDQAFVIGGDLGCGSGIDGNWNSSWTIKSTANGTDTTLTITA